MKAAHYTQYGPPEVLQVKEIEKPVPKDTEVLIKIYASVVGPSDCAFRKADPFIIRFMAGLLKPGSPSLGAEFAGEIEAVGKAVTLFKKGDPVFGMTPNFGAHAQYMCLTEDQTITTKPTNATYEEAVGICDGAATSLTFLRDVARLQRGQKILINGASGAVGAYGVQLARHYGAEVTGVCSGTNVALVKSLGADRVIDYTKEDFTKSGPYDVIFDAVGKSSFSECKDALTPNGVYMTTVPSFGIVFQVLRTMFFGRKKAKFATAGLMQSKDNMNVLKGLVEAGTLKAVIDRCYPLEQIVEAHRYVETGRKKGNVIITMAHNA
jgi:NADPH:quinone reductase-like Zn-dependent oxidoreductase